MCLKFFNAITVNKKQLGGDDVMLPEIGLGTWKYLGGVKPLRQGIKLGAFLIDTAASNGIEKSIPNGNVDGETVVSFQIIAQPVVA